MALFGSFKKSRNELIIPESTKSDPKAQELVRAWVANGDLHVSLRPDAWDNAATWGVLLADLAKHVAKAYHLNRQMDEAQVLNQIKAVIDAEFESPTEQPRGKIIN